MANAVRWETSLGSATTLINGADVAPTLKNLANAAMKLSAEYDNATNLHRFMTLELKVRLASAAAGPVDIYLVPCMDGTNYTDGGDSVAAGSNLYLGSFQTLSVNTQQRLAFVAYSTGTVFIPIPPCKFKILLKNSTGQNFTNTDAENLLYAYFCDEEIQ